ncbi:MAG: hypothetical protein C4325_04980, partial [Blastocatellia bacterium]
VLNGDILTDLDISSLISFHRKTGAEATISLAMVEDASKYGLVVFDSENRVLEFREKPAPYEIPVEGSAITQVFTFWSRPSQNQLQKVKMPRSNIRSFRHFLLRNARFMPFQ